MWKAMLDVSRIKEHVPIRDRNSIPRETECQFIVYIVATSRRKQNGERERNGADCLEFTSRGKLE